MKRKMTERVDHSGRELERRKDRAGSRVFARLSGAMCERDIQSLDFAETLVGP